MYLNLSKYVQILSVPFSWTQCSMVNGVATRWCKNFRRYVSSFWQNPQTWWWVRQTDGHHMTAYAALVHCIMQQKLYNVQT